MKVKIFPGKNSIHRASCWCCWRCLCVCVVACVLHWLWSTRRRLANGHWTNCTNCVLDELYYGRFDYDQNDYYRQLFCSFIFSNRSLLSAVSWPIDCTAIAVGISTERDFDFWLQSICVSKSWNRAMEYTLWARLRQFYSISFTYRTENNDLIGLDVWGNQFRLRVAAKLGNSVEFI